MKAPLLGRKAVLLRAPKISSEWQKERDPAGRFSGNAVGGIKCMMSAIAISCLEMFYPLNTLLQHIVS